MWAHSEVDSDLPGKILASPIQVIEDSRRVVPGIHRDPKYDLREEALTI